MIQFTNYVGVSPGTTTMEIPGMNGLGVCPPGYYGQNIMLPGDNSIVQPAAGAQMVTADPYANETRLSGLRAPMIRWDLLLLGFGVAFAGILGFAFYRSRRKK